MPRRTNPFQRLTAAIMAVFHEPEYSVEESVLVKNSRTGVIREIDIRITSRNNPKYSIMIECRAHKRRQDVQWIDALEGKSRGLGFSKTIAVSASGFTKTAIIEAHDRGIEALHLKKAEEIEWRQWMLQLQEIGFRLEGPKVTNIGFGVPPESSDPFPETIDLNKVILVDKRDNTRIPIHSWLDGLLNDPKEREKMKQNVKNSPVTPLKMEYPCAPGMGFVIEGIEEFIQLSALIININYIISDDKIPLDHMEMGEERLLVGDGPLHGIQSRVVMHENKGKLSVLLQQDNPKNKKE